MKREWFDNQKQSRSNFHQLLQERIENSNPRRQLNAEESKRLTKLDAIADKLRREATEHGELDTLIEQQAQFGKRVTQKHE